MLKILTILGLSAYLVNGTWSQIPRNGSEQDRPTQTRQGVAKPIRPSAPTVVQNETSPTKQKQKTSPKATGYQWHELLAPTNIPNWCLVGVGFWAGLMALITIKAIQRQSKAQMDATNPLLLVRPKRFLSNNFGLMFAWTAYNAGSTAAFITGHTTQLKFFANEKDFPETPGYGELFIRKSEPLLPQEEDEGDSINLGTGDASPEQIIECIAPEKGGILYAFGRVTYRDIYNREHETRYGFKWFTDASRYDVFGPDQYNRHT